MEDRLRYLFKRYLDNTCSEVEMEEFFGYVQRARHDDQLRQLIKKVYNNLADAGTDTFVDEKGRLIFSNPEWLQNTVKPGKTKSIRRWFTPRMAAGVVLTIGVLWTFITLLNGKSNRQPAAISSLTKKATNRSETKYILLEDSTQVWLNAASSLEFPDQFAENKREVFLTGEAFFDVRHADKIPFIIHTGDVVTTVLGTAFNIKAYPAQKNIIISVSRGKVKITGRNGLETTLTKGHQLKLRENGKNATEKNIPEETVAGWQQGIISYNDETLKDIISDMERIYNVTIHVSNKAVEELVISTSFKREIGIVQALQVLCKLTDTELTEKNGNYYIQ